MEVQHSLSVAGRAGGFGTQNQRRRWQWAWLGSASLHVVALGAAALGTAPAAHWQTHVQRGDSANIVLVTTRANPSPTVRLVSDLPVIEAEPPERLPEEPEPVRTTEHRPPLRPMVEEPIANRPSAEPLRISRATAASDLPVVSSMASPPRKRRPRLEPPPAAPPVRPAAVASQRAGAKIDSPPQQLPDNLPPRYPEQSRRMGQEGRVVLSAQLDQTGTVVKLAVKTSSGFPLLDRAAIEAVRQWRFQPATARSVPVASELLIPVRFSMRSGQ